jgi:hypothetical protein
MVQIKDETLKLLGKYIVVANSVSFLWRKMAESSIINYISCNESEEILLHELQTLLNKEEFNELDETKIYCFAIALLIKNRSLSNEILKLTNIDKVFWLIPLTKYANQDSIFSTINTVSQGSIYPYIESKSNNLTTQTIENFKIKQL